MTESHPIDTKIASFLASQTVLTIAVSENNIPYCAQCFYAYSDTENLLIFKSKKSANHVRIALQNKMVAGTITPNVVNKKCVTGLRFTGSFFQTADDQLVKAQRIYYAKFPFALIIPGELWGVSPELIRLTDQTLGFGKRIEWKCKTLMP